MSFLYNIFNKNKNKKIYLCGIESVGKSSILYKLISINNNNNNNDNNNNTQITPTVNGFNLETITLNNNKYDIFDIGGRLYNRILYRHYLDNSIDAIIFVYDQTERDINKINDSINELKYLLTLQPIKYKKFLILKSKDDLLNQNQQKDNNNNNNNHIDDPLNILLKELNNINNINNNNNNNNNNQQYNITIHSISIFNNQTINNCLEWISSI